MRTFQPDAVRDFIAFEGREELKAAVQELNSQDGLTRLQTFTAVLKDTYADLKTLAPLVKRAEKARDDGRLQICVRSGLLLVLSNEGHKVEGFYSKSSRRKPLAICHRSSRPSWRS